MSITILELATYRLGRDASTGADFEEAGLQIMGGCGGCGASLAAYNAYPSRDGYWRCSDCIEDDGWETVEEANAALFTEPGKFDTARLARLLRQYAASDAWENSLIGDSDVELLNAYADHLEAQGS